MLPLNKSFWSKDQNDLFKGSIWNDFFQNEFGRNLDMVPKADMILFNGVEEFCENNSFQFDSSVFSRKIIFGGIMFDKGYSPKFV